MITVKGRGVDVDRARIDIAGLGDIAHKLSELLRLVPTNIDKPYM